MFVLTAALCCPTIALAQTASAPVAPTEAPQAAPASVGHAAAKGLTLKVGNAAFSMAVFYFGTASLVASGALAVATNVVSYGLYVGNEYLWDNYAPNTNISANGGSFDTGASLWRNTGKYLTFKPASMIGKFAVTYLVTGSLGASVAMVSVIGLYAPANFYLNNMLWDWYDWRANDTAPPAKGTGAALIAPAAPG
jgi:uncharacterized membrane protein